MKRLIYACINLGVAAALGLLFLLLFLAQCPEGPGGRVRLAGRDLPTLCPYRLLTSRPCPGCGLTRAMVLAVHGDMTQARRSHPAAPWVAGWCVAQATMRLLLAAWKPVPKTSYCIADGLVSIVTFVLAAYGPALVSASF